MQVDKWIMLYCLFVVWAIIYTFEFQWAAKMVSKVGTFRWRFVAPLTITFIVYVVLFAVIAFG